ncbi:protein phosphatase 1 regulatory subunit 15A [Notamacropus eugenii]|uniref:protein phosphatase 1 regulatory subunit 15A n=1 Tax=Notamacropus eugenii TaxID=9315 RepID=UPI003B6818BA
MPVDTAMPVHALAAPRMTRSPDPPNSDLGHSTGISLGASFRGSLFSDIQLLLAWTWSQLWNVGLQPKPRGEAKDVNPEARTEEEEGPFNQAPGPWPEVRRAQASSSLQNWVGQVRKEGDQGVAEGPADLESGEQKVHDGASRREEPGNRPTGLVQRDDGQDREQAARGILMPGENKGNENEEGEGVGDEIMPEAEQSLPSLVDSCPQGLWPLAWQLREEAEERGIGGAEEGDGKGGSSSQPHPVLTSPLLRAWAYRPGEDEGDEDEEDVSDGEEGAANQPPSPMLTSPLLRAWAYRPGEDEGDEDEEDVSDGEEGAANQPPPPMLTSPLLRAWAYRPGEDESDDDDEDDVSDGEGGAANQPPPPVLTSPLLRAWAYRPGEDEGDEDEEDVSDGEEGAANQPPPPVLTSPLLRAWAYRPGEDEGDDEDEDEDDVSDGEGGAANQPPPPVLTSPLLRAWACRPGEENDDQEDAEGAVCRAGPGLQVFRVSIFVPGAEQPSPWPSPQLPQRLKKRLRPRRTPVEPEPESPPGRKVRFSSTVGLHLLAVWAGPARAARRGPWEQLARDRSRFARRITQAEAHLGPCLCPAARARAWMRLQALTISPQSSSQGGEGPYPSP